MNNYVSPPPSAGVNSLATRIGQLFFSIMSHFLYDLGLYRFISPYIWRCSTQRLLDNYVENISRNHLEIGVGSGYFLKRTLCADFLQRLVLLDLNGRCLKKSVRRLQEFAPEGLHELCFALHSRRLPDQPTYFYACTLSSGGRRSVLWCNPAKSPCSRGFLVLVDDEGVKWGWYFSQS